MYRFLFLPLLLCSQLLVAQRAKPAKAASPNWITVNNYDYGASSLDKKAQDGYIDLVYEEQVNLNEQATYTRKAYKILSDAGVQENSELSISYDPSYSRIIFHSIKIIRGKESFNQLDLSKIKTIQQERELARHSYNGTLSAVIFLEDVRKGDIVEYSYTIQGFNPIFKGKYSGFLNTSYSVPIYNVFYKLLVPQGRNINIKNSQINIQPVVKHDNTNTSYEWKLTERHPVKTQDNIPSWYDLYSMIIVSEFNSWSEVSKWASELFQNNIHLSPALQKKINEIVASSPNDESKILTALRFVQDEVRYMGIEMGVNSHKPSDPSKIYSQRYGDCKDKSYLLCSMLTAMGIEAQPVLINTSYKKTIENWLPAPIDFDHVTTRVKLNGRYYWFDPTISYQRGRIDDISYPDYQVGLIIADTSSALTHIPLHDEGETRVKEIFDIPDTYGRAKLKVITEYSGSFADDVRRSMNTNSQEEIKEIGRKFYSTFFDKIEVDSVTSTDNESNGTLTINEYYSLKDVWDVDKGRKSISFKPYIIDGVMTKPDDVDRKMPFSLTFPARYKETIEINLPDEWEGEETEHNIHCKGFKLRTQYSYQYRQFKLEYDYENLKDHIDANESDEYLRTYKKASESLAYEISIGSGLENHLSEKLSAGNFSSALTLVLLFIGVLALVIFVAKKI